MWERTQIAVGVAATVAAAGWLVRLMARRGWGRCTAKESLRGRTALVTGASSGLGRTVVEQLFARGAFVILACRDLRAARALVELLRKKYPDGGETMIAQLDMASLESVRTLAGVVRMTVSKLDILVDNAGVYLPVQKKERTEDGFEMHFGVNHLAHFLLTNLLLDLLKNAAPSRIVVVSSLLHERGRIDFDDLDLLKTLQAINNGDKDVIKRTGRHNPGYCNTKLMNVYFARALAEKTEGTGIDVFSVCPGFTYTNLFRHSIKWYHYILMIPVLILYMRTPEEGSQTILHCALEPSLQGKSGGFYRNCKPYCSKIIFDKDIQNKLWKVSEDLVESKTKQD